MTDYDSPIFESDRDLSESLSQLETDSPPLEIAAPHSERPPGPGILESIVWTIGVMPMQLAGALLAAIVIFVLYAVESNLTPRQLQEMLKDENQLQQIVNSYAGLNLGIIMSVFLTGVVMLILIRLGSHRRRAIPVSFPSIWHILLTVLWVIPLSLLCGQLGLVADLGWERITALVPALKSLDDLNLMDQIGKIVEGIPDWQVYLLIAVFPAVSEELLFRVLLGRGLVARYGVIVGIALTTLLFASVHLHPVHMVALMPLAVAIHLSYLCSRTIWVPMLAHCLNNALAVAFLLASLGPQAEPMPAEALGEDAFLPWWLTLAALSFSVSIGLLYWQSRVVRIRWSEPTWEIEQESFVSADRRMLSPTERYQRQLPPIGYIAVLFVTMVFFGVSLSVHLMNLAGKAV